MLLHSVPYFLIDVIHHLLQGMLRGAQLPRRDSPAEGVVKISVYFFNLFCGRNRGFCQIQVPDPAVLFIDGGPDGIATVPGLMIFREAFSRGLFGYGCAIGFVIFLVTLVLTLINNKFVRVNK